LIKKTECVSFYGRSTKHELIVYQLVYIVDFLLII